MANEKYKKMKALKISKDEKWFLKKIRNLNIAKDEKCDLIGKCGI